MQLDQESLDRLEGKKKDVVEANDVTVRARRDIYVKDRKVSDEEFRPPSRCPWRNPKPQAPNYQKNLVAYDGAYPVFQTSNPSERARDSNAPLQASGRSKDGSKYSCWERQPSSKHQ